MKIDLVKNTPTFEQLQAVATKLNLSSEETWAILLQQAYTYGVSKILLYSIIYFIYIVFVTLSYMYIRNDIKSQNKQKLDDLDDGTLIWCIHLGLAVVMLFVTLNFLADLQTIIMAFSNPEFWVLERIR